MIGTAVAGGAPLVGRDGFAYRARRAAAPGRIAVVREGDPSWRREMPASAVDRTLLVARDLGGGRLASALGVARPREGPPVRAFAALVQDVARADRTHVRGALEAALGPDGRPEAGDIAFLIDEGALRAVAAFEAEPGEEGARWAGAVAGRLPEGPRRRGVLVDLVTGEAFAEAADAPGRMDAAPAETLDPRVVERLAEAAGREAEGA